MINRKAVVMGRNYASLLGMVRAAGKAGCDVTVIRSVSRIPDESSFRFRCKRLLCGDPIESTSRYVEKYLYSIEPDADGLVNLLKREFPTNENKVILLPTDDYTASVIDQRQEELKDRFTFPNIHNEVGAVIKLMDKNIQKQMAIACGLQVAKGWVITIQDGIYNIPDDIEYPCFTKPEISFLGNKRCMKRCDTLKELTDVVEEVAKNGDCPILVEQYVEIEREYGMLGFCDGNVSYIPAMIHKIAIGNGAHRGVTLLGRVIPVQRYAELHQKILQMISTTGFVGLFDIDLYENNGIIYFNELNLRLGAFGYSVFCAGINLPQMLIQTLSGKAVQLPKNEITKEIICLNDKVNLEDYAAGYITREQYQNTIGKADCRFIDCDGDVRPAEIYHKMERFEHVKHLVKKKKG